MSKSMYLLHPGAGAKHAQVVVVVVSLRKGGGWAHTVGLQSAFGTPHYDHEERVSPGYRCLAAGDRQRKKGAVWDRLGARGRTEFKIDKKTERAVPVLPRGLECVPCAQPNFATPPYQPHLW